MKSSRIVQLAMFAMLVFGGVKTASADPIYSFTTISFPGAFSTSAYGINNSGQIVGRYFGVFPAPPPVFVMGLSPGFLNTGGSFSSFNAPGACLSCGGTIARGINDSGQIVGFFADALGVHGFLDAGGSFTTIDVPGASFTQPYGINNSGQIVGNSSLGAFVDTGGSFTFINVPGAIGTTASGINNSGQIVGSFRDASGVHGFVDPDGSFTTIDVPGAPLFTNAYGINNRGQIVGTFSDAFGLEHGFVDTGGSFTNIDFKGTGACCGATDVATGINDSGEIVGIYGFRFTVGFLATPVATPEPPSLLTLATCLVALFAIAWRRKRASARNRLLA